MSLLCFLLLATRCQCLGFFISASSCASSSVWRAYASCTRACCASASFCVLPASATSAASCPMDRRVLARLAAPLPLLPGEGRGPAAEDSELRVLSSVGHVSPSSPALPRSPCCCSAGGDAGFSTSTSPLAYAPGGWGEARSRRPLLPGVGPAALQRCCTRLLERLIAQLLLVALLVLRRDRVMCCCWAACAWACCAGGGSDLAEPPEPRASPHASSSEVSVECGRPSGLGCSCAGVARSGSGVRSMDRNMEEAVDTVPMECGPLWVGRLSTEPGSAMEMRCSREEREERWCAIGLLAGPPSWPSLGEWKGEAWVWWLWEE
mmetsp:Transcript_27497/g.69977  ORF Transcript_27497/g.69977 Transcript_27497/m.69977 type:complete len:321 (-) Transcript_27497:597-1559(-)